MTYVKRNKEKTKIYVDNDRFLEAIIEYKQALKQHRDRLAAGMGGNMPPEEVESPRISEYLGDCFLKIAKNYSYNMSFIGYKFRDDMVMDAVYFCIKYIDTFDPEKSKNPFSYFTTTCHNAFLQKIFKEKKHLYTKYKAIENSEIFSELSENHEHLESMSGNDELVYYSEGSKDKRNEFVENFEKNLEKAKKKQEEAAAKKKASSKLDNVKSGDSND